MKRYYPWIVVGLLWVVALLNYMDRQMLSVMQSAMGHDISILQDSEAFGFLMSIFLYIYGSVSPFAGMVADRISRKWLIVGSLFVWSFVTFMMGYCSTFNQLVVLRGIMGISEALYIPSALSLIADWHQGKSRSLAVGIHMTGLYTGQAIGGFGATIAAGFSWQQTFQGFGMIGIVYSVVLILFLRDNRQNGTNTDEIVSTAEKPSIIKGLSIIFGNVAFWVILFFFASSSFPGWGIKNWVPTLFSENLGIEMAKAGPISTITIALSSFVGVIFGGSLSDKWVLRSIRGRIYTSAIGLGMMIPALVLLGLSHSYVGITGAGVLFGIGYGMFDANNMPILCQFVSAKYRATAYGIMNMVGVFAGAVITQVLGKWTNAGNLGMSFAFMGVIVFIAMALQLSVLRPKTDNVE